MSYKVNVEPSGHQFTVEEGETVLDAALRQGITLPYGCRSGTCGSCKGKIIEGEVDYGNSSPKALNEAELASGMALLCQAVPRSNVSLSVREISTEQEIPIKQLPARVAKIERMAHDVMGLYLKLPTNQRLQFLAGQYVDFILRDGKRRSYSIANPPHDDDLLEFHVRYVPDGVFSEFVFNQMEEKQIVRIEGPFGQFFLREESERPIILMAGGTGFAPIKGVIEHALSEGVRRPIYLYWGVRARRDLYWDELPRQWAADHGHFQYIPVLSEPAPDDAWEGRTGYVHEAVLADFSDLSAYDVYAAGPPPMVEAGRQAFNGRGLVPEHYYCDAFEYARD